MLLFTTWYFWTYWAWPYAGMPAGSWKHHQKALNNVLFSQISWLWSGVFSCVVQSSQGGLNGSCWWRKSHLQVDLHRNSDVVFLRTWTEDGVGHWLDFAIGKFAKFWFVAAQKRGWKPRNFVVDIRGVRLAPRNWTKNPDSCRHAGQISPMLPIWP